MNRKNLLLAGTLALGLASCVSKKKLAAEQAKYAELNTFYTQVQTDLKACRDAQDEAARRRSQLEGELESARTQLAQQKESNTLMVNQLKDLSVISASQAESIKKSLENIGSKDAYIQDLNRAIQRKDSLNLALVTNLKSALKDINDQDIEVKVEKSAIFISISDKLLFKSGSYEVSPAAMTVLGKVAQVLNAKPEIEFLVEGHTDNVPITGGAIQDNWDLSTKRATSIVRILQKQFSIDPKRMTAGGRGEYLPLQGNEGPAGRAANRRTRIVILPQLDQFFKLLEKPQQ
ncbi:OmpA/MotB family protein [Flaviaesturariibacter amylovorans]|uniref:OmpA family protein n=1 Tax=Flaviaesturariibacter amylovorans TaxID=1084520 RepID=A0ABP8HE91_9BACT